MDPELTKPHLARNVPGGDLANVESSSASLREERLAFLKQAISFTEWSIRSFDTKAQISIAAFVLSMNPLWSFLTLACPRAGSSFMVLALLACFLTTVLLFGYVIWPVRLAESQIRGSWQSKGLFYISDPNDVTTGQYVARLGDSIVEEELAAESLKLAFIRETKSKRFKNALRFVVLFYALFFGVYLMLRGCPGA